MSVVIETFMMCDGGCGRNFGVDCRHESISQHRAAMLEEGWIRVGRKDICPDCQTASKLLEQLQRKTTEAREEFKRNQNARNS